MAYSHAQKHSIVKQLQGGEDFSSSMTFSFFVKYFLYLFLFIFSCVGSLLLRVGFLQLRRAGATLHCSARASHCSGLSCCGARALGTRASVVVALGPQSAWASVVVMRRLSSCGLRSLEHKLSSCGTQAQLLCGMWDLPGPGIKPMPLHWQADSQPLCHQGSPSSMTLLFPPLFLECTFCTQ